MNLVIKDDKNDKYKDYIITGVTVLRINKDGTKTIVKRKKSTRALTHGVNQTKEGAE